MAERILMNEFKTLSKEPWAHIELDNDNVFNWNVALIVVNPDSYYHGGFFKAKMTFPKNYPYSPPDFKFLRPLYHPNIYKDGKLCISILHPPGDDEMSGETAAERWSPAQRVESVLISILSLLDDAETSSPANVDASVTLRRDLAKYKELVRQDVEASRKDIPEGFVMPTTVETAKPREEKEDKDFWYDSDENDDFNGSDSDMELDANEFDDDDDDEPDMDSPSEDEEVGDHEEP